MKLVGNLTSGIAHDFNNLLTVIATAFSGLRDEAAYLSGGPEHKKEMDLWLDDLDGAASRASLLTRQPLSFGRASSADLRGIDVSEVLSELVKMLPRLLGAHIELRADVCSRAPVMASRSGLEQILLNLAVNVRDAMPQGGVLQFRVTADDSRVYLACEDNGQGMDQELSARIFEPFFSTKATGTGLGLATVKDLVQRFSGLVRVESAPGRETRFELSFPRYGGETRARDPQSQGPRVGRELPTKKRVVLVEGDPLVRQGLARSLTRLGFETLPLADGAEALAVIRSGTRVQCLVGDISMPQLDGEKLAHEVREHDPELPMILFGVHWDPAAAAASSGRHIFLSKPIGIDQLAGLLDRLTEAAVPPSP